MLLILLVCLDPVVSGYPVIPRELVYKYSYPYLSGATVPIRMLSVGAVVASAAVLLAAQVTFRKYMHCTVDILHFLLALSMTALTSYIPVQALKMWVARPRPDFLERCYPDGINMAAWTPIPNCTRPLSNKIVNDGLQSFPSGHSACAWGVGVFCFLYLSEKARFFSSLRRNGSTIPRCLPFVYGFVSCIFSTYIGCTRIWDYQHHVEDVIAGALIGITSACCSFYLYYPIHPRILCTPMVADLTMPKAQGTFDDLSHKPLCDAGGFSEYDEV